VEFLRHELLDHPGHEIQAILNGGRVLLHMLAIIAFRDLIHPQPLGDIQRMCHWRYLVGVGLTQLVDKIDYPRELCDGLGELFIAYFESSQHRNVLNLIFIE
jgi:hypothetical protein